MARLVGLSLFLVAFTASALIWHPGSVVMADGTVIAGEISRQSNDLILVRSVQGVTVLPAHMVHSFRFHDPDQNINRKFLALPSSDTSSPYVFLESVTAGKLTVLRKQRHFSERVDEQDAGDFAFFILSGDQLTPMRTFRSKYYEEVRSEAGRSGTDISSLDPTNPADILRLIILFNQLPATPSIAAI